jgi:chemotaxis protein histidine kinase CheA
MSRVRSFFIREATDSLETLREELVRETPDLRRSHAAARLLRGSAQMARFGALARQAEVLEGALRSASRGAAEWTAEGAASARRQLGAIEGAVEAVRTGRTEADSRTEAAMDGQQGGGAGVVPIEEMEYGGRRALERALEMRGALEDAIVAEEPVGPLLEELFDLIRLGMG